MSFLSGGLLDLSYKSLLQSPGILRVSHSSDPPVECMCEREGDPGTKICAVVKVSSHSRK